MAIRYIVNEDKRVVVAVIDGAKYDAINSVNAWLKNSNDVCVCIQDCKKYWMPNTFAAVAKCQDGDVFSVEEGKKIARNRVLNKYHKSLNKRVHRANYDLLAKVTNLGFRIQKLRHTN